MNDRLIYADITAFGEEDERPGFDAVLQAETGFMGMNGTEASGPVKMPVALIDLLLAHQLKEALLIALIERMQSGRGSYNTVSLFQSGVASLANQAANYLVAGTVPGRTGSDHPNIAPYGTVFRTRNGDPVVLAVGTDSQFQALCEVLGIPDAAEDGRFATNQQRVVHREALNGCWRNGWPEWKETPCWMNYGRARYRPARSGAWTRSLTTSPWNRCCFRGSERTASRSAACARSPSKATPCRPLPRWMRLRHSMPTAGLCSPTCWDIRKNGFGICRKAGAVL